MNVVRTDFSNPEDNIMKRIVLTAALATLIIGASAQAGPLTNQEIFATFGEETYLDDHSMNRVDMASMEIRGTNESTPDYGISINAVHEIFGEEHVGKSLPRADMASMEIRSKRGPSTFGGNNEASAILDLDI